MKIFENTPIKNVPVKTKLSLADEVEYRDGQVVSKTLQQNTAVSITLFAFDEGEEISTHAAGGDALVVCLDGQGRITIGGDALVTVLDGKGRFTIDGEPFFLSAGESIVMPRNVPHAVYGEERFKMLLTVVF